MPILVKNSIFSDFFHDLKKESKKGSFLPPKKGPFLGSKKGPILEAKKGTF